MNLTINDNKFKIKVQTSSKELRKGMMFKTFDETFNGMLFVKQLEEHCFIMENCIIPLDIIFIDGDTITKIHHNCKPSNDKDNKRYCGYGNYIFEVEGGTCKNLGIKKGDKVTLPLQLKEGNETLKNFIRNIIKEEVMNIY
jgi:uncharacterized membrane protein (UPF0127 family)